MHDTEILPKAYAACFKLCRRSFHPCICGCACVLLDRIDQTCSTPQQLGLFPTPVLSSINTQCNSPTRKQSELLATDIAKCPLASLCTDDDSRVLIH
jgi:hypothetical protein